MGAVISSGFSGIATNTIEIKTAYPANEMSFLFALNFFESL